MHKKSAKKIGMNEWIAANDTIPWYDDMTSAVNECVCNIMTAKDWSARTSNGNYFFPGKSCTIVTICRGHQFETLLRNLGPIYEMSILATGNSCLKGNINKKLVQF